MWQEVSPITNRKSFYGKAMQQDKGDSIVLTSYNTEVAAVNKDNNFVITKLSDVISNTTINHIRAFLQEASLTKKLWSSIAVDKPFTLNGTRTLKVQYLDEVTNG